MGMSGSLGSVKISELFQMLSMNTEHQVLTLTKTGENRRFYFAPSSVSINRSESKLGPIGEILVKLGKLTEEQLQAAILEQGRDGGRLGEILVKQGSVTQEDIDYALRLQLEDELYEILTWREGEFGVSDYNPGDFESGELISFDIMSILMEAARRMDEMQSFQHVISSSEDVFIKSSTWDIPETGVPHLHIALGRMLDGTSTVREILGKLKLSKFEIYEALYQWHQAGKIHRLESARLVHLAEACFQMGKVEEGIGLMRRASELDTDNIQLREKIADICARAGREREASEAYEVLAKMYMEQGADSRALGVVQKSLKMDKDNMNLWELGFQLSLKTGKVAEAVNAARHLVVRLMESGNFESAYQYCNQLLGSAADNAEFRLKAIDCASELGDFSSALAHCEAVEKVLGRQDGQVVKAFTKLSQKFPGQGEAAVRLSRLKSASREAQKNRMALTLSVLGAAFAGILLGVSFYEQLDRLFNL